MATTRILATGKIVGGAIEMDVAVPPFMLTKHAYIEYLCGVADDEPVAHTPADGTLQAAIDYGAELQELQDDMEDRAFWASGAW